VIKGSVTRHTGEMSERDSMEAFVEGAKKAASAAKELAKACNSVEWENVVTTLNALRDGGRQLANMRSMSRLETLMAANIKANPKGILN
jgi:hypothetical protein